MTTTGCCITGDGKGQIKTWALNSSNATFREAGNCIASEEAGAVVVMTNDPHDTNSAYAYHTSGMLSRYLYSEGVLCVMRQYNGAATAVDAVALRVRGSVPVVIGRKGEVVVDERHPPGTLGSQDSSVDAACFPLETDDVVFVGGKNRHVAAYALPEGGDALWQADSSHPIHVTSLLSLGPTCLIAATMAKTLLLYDTRVGGMKALPLLVPLVTMSGRPTTLAASSPESRTIFVGDGYGDVGMVDIRKQDRTSLLGLLKGGRGAVTSLSCVPSTPFVMSTTRDRFLRLHTSSWRDQPLIAEVCIKTVSTGCLPHPACSVEDLVRACTVKTREKASGGAKGSAPLRNVGEVYGPLMASRTSAHVWDGLDVVCESAPPVGPTTSVQLPLSSQGKQQEGRVRRIPVLRKNRRDWFYARHR